MSRRSRAWLGVAVLCTCATLGASPLRADYIVCYEPKNAQSRISCEAVCQQGEWLVQRSEQGWAGCEAEGPDCGTAWSEWADEVVVAPDPCSAGCWRTETLDTDFRTRNDMAEMRDLWQCRGMRDADR